MRNPFSSPIGRVIAAFIAVGLFTSSMHGLRLVGSQTPDFPCKSGANQIVAISVAKGDSGSKIARKLYAARVVASSEAFFRLAVSDDRAQRIAPGTHLLSLHLCAQEALEQLLDSKRIKGLIAVTEGMWLSEVVTQMEEAGFSRSSITAAITKVSKPEGFSYLEGLLYPALYSFDKDATADTALVAMVNRASLEFEKIGLFATKGKYSPQQLLVIASLIQAEGNTKDFSKISRVIRNRLQIGMPLQFDSTVHYVKKSRGSVFLSTQSTFINSPYNTYRKYGLPPGPINNPGIEAVKAALHPATGDWLYFITVAPFDTRFTSKIAQFNEWKIEYKKNLRAGKFRSTP